MQRRLRKESPPEADAAAPQKASAESIQPTFDEAARGLLDERGNPPPAVSQLGARYGHRMNPPPQPPPLQIGGTRHGHPRPLFAAQENTSGDRPSPLMVHPSQAPVSTPQASIVASSESLSRSRPLQSIPHQSHPAHGRPETTRPSPLGEHSVQSTTPPYAVQPSSVSNVAHPHDFSVSSSSHENISRGYPPDENPLQPTESVSSGYTADLSQASSFQFPFSPDDPSAFSGQYPHGYFPYSSSGAYDQISHGQPIRSLTGAPGSNPHPHPLKSSTPAQVGNKQSLQSFRGHHRTPPIRSPALPPQGSLFESAVTAEHGGLPRSPLLSPHGGSLLSPLDTPQESPLQTPLTSDGFPPFAPTPVHTESDEEDHYAERYLSASGKAVRREKRPAIPNRNLRRGRVVLAEPTPPLVQDNVRRNKRRSVSTSGRLQGLRSLTDLRADFARLASDDLGSSHKVVDSKDFMYYAARLDRPRLSEETQTPTSQASPFLPFSNQSRPSKDAYRITPPSLEVGNTKQRLASSESQTSSIGRWKIIARRSDKAKAKAKAERKERGRAETGEEKRNSDGTKRLVMNYDELVLLERFNAAGYPSRGDAKKTLSADGPAGLPRGRHEGYESFRVPSRGYPPSSAGSSVRPSGEITSPLGSPPICRSLDPTFLRNASCSLDEPRAGASPSKSRSCPAKGALSSLSTSVSASKLGSDPKEAAPGPAPRKKKSRFKRIFSKEGSAAGPQTRSAELQVLEAQDNELLEVRLDERHLNVIVLVLQTSADEVSVQAGSIRGLLGEVLAPVFTSRTYEQMIAYDTLIAQSIFFLADRLDLLGFMAERFKEAEALEAPGLQLKILTLLNVWLECKPEDVVEWDDEPLNLVLNSARNKRGVVADTCRQLGRKVSAVRVQDSKHEAMLQKTSKAITWKGEVHAAISFLENFAPETTELDCVEVNLLAKYLAAVDLVFFREATQPKQLELKLKQLHGGGTPTHLTNLDHRQMIQRAGRLAMRAEMIKHWTLCSVFNTRSPERRGHVASQFVFVAHRLITYGDLEGASVIVNALRSDCFTRQDFPVTWWHMERLGSAGVLDNVSAMLTDSYKRTLTNLADPVTPIFTGKQGLFAKMLEEHSSMPHFIRTALNTLEGQEARCVPAETALKYAWEPRMLASGPLLDLSKYERMWQLHAAARARVKVAHPYGTVTRDAYVMQLYEPGRFCWGTEEGFCPTKPTPNKQLDALSELVERSILRRWTMMAPGALSLEDSRPMVLQALRARGVEGERRYGY